MNLREQKAQTITDDQIKKIDNYTYKVKSQSSDKWYDIVSIESGFVCSCPDSTFRKTFCKHSIALEISLEIRKKVEEVKQKQVTINPIDVSGCKFCESDNIIKKGLRKNKNYSIQTFLCKDCKKKFSINIGFEKMRATPQAITASMNLYFNGESLRHVANSMKLFGVEVTYQTIHNWIKKYIGLMDGYLESITPQVSDKWYCDEIYLKIKGDRKYLYAMLDDQSRFWIASQVANTKYTEDVRPLFRKSTEVAGKKPKILISDGARNFMQAHKKEWYSNYKNEKVTHIRHIHFKGDKNTNKMERLNGEIRDREKVMRSLKKENSPILTGMQIHHNYIRTHMALNNDTPADRVGIKIEGNNKWITLIQNASKNH
jgi:transposase-like protein